MSVGFFQLVVLSKAVATMMAKLPMCFLQSSTSRQWTLRCQRRKEPQKFSSDQIVSSSGLQSPALHKTGVLRPPPRRVDGQLMEMAASILDRLPLLVTVRHSSGGWRRESSPGSIHHNTSLDTWPIDLFFSDGFALLCPAGDDIVRPHSASARDLAVG
jgi:hypothetical protein